MLTHFTHNSCAIIAMGVSEAVDLFGAIIINAESISVSIEELGLQHLAEDMSRIASAADWLAHMEFRISADQPARPPPSAEEFASRSIFDAKRRFGAMLGNSQHPAVPTRIMPRGMWAPLSGAFRQ